VAREEASSLVVGWTVVLVAVSLVAHASGWIVGVLAFEPDRVLRGELWRLVTWIFVEESLTRVVVTCLLLHRFGHGLAHAWGERALARYMTVILVGVAVATTLLAVVLPPVQSTVTIGGWAVRAALLIACARQFPDRDLLLGDLPVARGPTMIACVVGVTGLLALVGGVLTSLPELLTCAAACAYPIRTSGR
jgi:membrane associated rhomboid family serine protease